MGFIHHLRGVIQKLGERLPSGAVRPAHQLHSPSPASVGPSGYTKSRIGKFQFISVDQHVFRGGIRPVKTDQQSWAIDLEFNSDSPMITFLLFHCVFL